MKKFMKMTGIIAVTISLAATMMAGCSKAPSTSNSPSSSSSNQSSSQIKGTGKVVVYAALNQTDIDWIQTQFKADTGIDVQYLLFSAGDAAARVEAEKANPQADVMIGGSTEYYGNLENDGLLDKYTSPNSKGLDKQFIDSNGYWQGWYMGVLGIVYNTDLITSKGLKAPTSWDDLLDASYKKQIVNSNPATAGGGYIFAADQLFRLGDEKGWDYLNKLNANVDHYTKAAGDPITLVATGQFAIGVAWAHDIVAQQKKGFPIKVVVPDNTAFEIGGAGVIKGAADSENAKKFIDWLLTKPVQEKNTSVSNRYSVRTDVNAPEGMVSASKVKLVDYDRAKATSMKTDVVNKFTAMIGG